MSFKHGRNSVIILTHSMQLKSLSLYLLDSLALVVWIDCKDQVIELGLSALALGQPDNLSWRPDRC